MENERYKNPLSSRYAGKEMNFNWSPQKKHSTWRRLWLALAESEKELGLNISEKQLNELRANLDNIDFERAYEKEKELKHDVMSHIHTFGEQCPAAKPIIHLGATSCFVTDNTEQIQIKHGLKILQRKLLHVISRLAEISENYRYTPTLGFTHYQPAQLTTVGKRFSLYLQDFYFDYQKLNNEMNNIPFRGVKGTTGTQASFLNLFNGDKTKLKKLNEKVCSKMGFQKLVPVSGQTYTRKIDFYVLSILSAIAQSAHKLATDLRLLAHSREIEEPFESTQVGSSAMAYKRNPIRSERICSLARYVISLPANSANNHANQWLERTLDDSANRRIVLPEAFLAADAILSLILNVTGGLKIWENVIANNVKSELPFMATENILMAAVKKGGDRQELHESIRKHSMQVMKDYKEKGIKKNDLLKRIKGDPLFEVVKDDIEHLVEPKEFIGNAPAQVKDFLNEEIYPLLKKNNCLKDKDNKDTENFTI